MNKSIDLQKESLWQKGSSSVWYTNIRPTCDICGHKNDRVLEFKVSEEDDGLRACFLVERSCSSDAMNLLFAQNAEIEYLWAREIEFKKVGQGDQMGKRTQREPIGLAKRYSVMKRDGFQCVLCGARGRDAKLEIDHIVPVASGGRDDASNLRTLCFNCNRGKTDSSE